MKVYIHTIQMASKANIMADGYLIQRNDVDNWQVNPDGSLSVFVVYNEYVFTEREHTNAMYDWLNPDRVDDVGLHPRWKQYQIDWDKVGAPLPVEY
jgi:hypothetical protein